MGLFICANVQTPKLSAIACWASGKYGHAAVVVVIHLDGAVTLLEPHYFSKANGRWFGLPK